MFYRSHRRSSDRLVKKMIAGYANARELAAIESNPVVAQAWSDHAARLEREARATAFAWRSRAALR